jgi:hypothetical protein
VFAEPCFVLTTFKHPAATPSEHWNVVLVTAAASKSIRASSQGNAGRSAALLPLRNATFDLVSETRNKEI